MFKLLRTTITRSCAFPFKNFNRKRVDPLKAFYSPIQRSFTTKNLELDEKLAEQKINDLFAKEDQQFRQGIEEGVTLLKKGQFEDAQDVLLLALRISDINDGHINHGSGLACYYLGVIYQKMGDFEKALYFFERTVECLLHEKSTTPKVTIENTQNDPELAKKLKEIAENTAKIEQENQRFKLKEEDLKSLHQNVMKAVKELEKHNFYGPLSSYIRKENLSEEYKKIPKMLEKPEENLKNISLMLFRMSDILLIEKNADCVKTKLTGLSYFEKLYKDDPKAMFTVYLEMGKFFLKLNNTQQAETFYLKAMSLIEKIEPTVRDEYMFNLHLKGLTKVYNQKGEFEKVLISYKKTLELIENSLKDKMSPKEKAMIYYATGHFLIKTKQEKEAFLLWFKAEKISEEAGDKKMAAKMSQDIGRLYEMTKDLKGARNAYEKSIALCQEIYGKEHNLTKNISKERLQELLKLSENEKEDK